ncbi:MAG: glutamine--tRNA ligase/YqeY domain fusion protein [Oscillospiraceae bacterium]|jgi:glutaminyl-tRNA synthetase|nr:glutamine--tRNA ligase/YqeY domain fusion protein [Oscillospiraceae bacterium]
MIPTEKTTPNENFIHDIIDADLAAGRCTKVHTRFPPEPNGCIHIGSAKAIYVNYEAAKKYGGLFNLRFDDTNPVKEDESFVRSIIANIKWLIGGEPSGGIFYGSDYFDRTYEYAVKLIKDGKAYVCDLSNEQVREFRGSLTLPGQNSPYRNRSVEENLELFERMKNGEFGNGTRTLRAKIDMSSPNMNMRDPVIYRILHAAHHRQGDKWKIYPMYDFAHTIQDAIEGITHSCCSLEFENHRPLYDWVADNIGLEEAEKPHQYEFARLNMTYTIMSKRYLGQLVEKGLVEGWDDPRMPTLAGIRRRGYTPSSILEFVKRAGVAKAHSVVDSALLEFCLREELDKTAERRIAVTEPLLVTITNYPEDKTEFFSLPNNPVNPEAGTRRLPFTRQLYVERDDFAEVPPPKFHRLKPGGEVRLMGAYIIKCDEVIKDENGAVTGLLCTADIETGNNMPTDGRKVKGTIHWLSAAHAEEAVLALYDRLFTIENVFDIPENSDFNDYINPDSLRLAKNAKVEPSLKSAVEGEKFQFVRTGYFTVDSKNKGVFNKTVPLKSSYKP